MDIAGQISAFAQGNPAAFAAIVAVAVIALVLLFRLRRVRVGLLSLLAGAALIGAVFELFLRQTSTGWGLLVLAVVLGVFAVLAGRRRSAPPEPEPDPEGWREDLEEFLGDR